MPRGRHSTGSCSNSCVTVVRVTRDQQQATRRHHRAVVLTSPESSLSEDDEHDLHPPHLHTHGCVVEFDDAFASSLMDLTITPTKLPLSLPLVSKQARTRGVSDATGRTSVMTTSSSSSLVAAADATSQQQPDQDDHPHQPPNECITARNDDDDDDRPASDESSATPSSTTALNSNDNDHPPAAAKKDQCDSDEDECDSDEDDDQDANASAAARADNDEEEEEEEPSLDLSLRVLVEDGLSQSQYEEEEEEEEQVQAHGHDEANDHEQHPPQEQYEYQPCQPNHRIHEATASILKRNPLDEIPIRNGRMTWKQLPKPSSHVLERCRSLPVAAKANAPNTDPPRSLHRRATVTFDAVLIRNFEQTVGDNPSVSYGPPITLDWMYSQSAPIDLDRYEKQRGPRRKPRQMMLNYYHRRNLLSWRFGVTEDELNQAEKAANRIKRERSITRALLPAQKLQEVLQSASRKTKRLTHGGGSNSSNGGATRALAV